MIKIINSTFKIANILTLIILSFYCSNAIAKCDMKRPRFARHQEYPTVRHFILARDGKNVKFNHKNMPISGEWACLYSKLTFKLNSSGDIIKMLEIDHKLPWAFYTENADNCDRALEFFNDPDNLITVSSAANRKKGKIINNKLYPEIKESNCNICNKYRLNNCDIVCN